MKPSSWEKVNALLDEVLTLPAEQREAYLDFRCQDDPALLEEVRSLLQAHEGAESFLETPADEYAATLVKKNASEEDPIVGQEVDGYRIVDVLGRGGMGVVYKARNLSLDRIEALKVITPLLVQNESFLRRFLLEAQALAKIHHPNIVTIYTQRESWLGHYITMEFVEGRTLADVIVEEGALPWQRAVDLSRQLLGAFEYAHQRGIIHRDIKPRNIMLTPGDSVKVMDFGLAKFYLQQEVTQTAGVSGTLCYMSPEQIKGASLDQRSDIFSLGLTLYEMLSGRLPFDRKSSQFGIQRAIVEDDFRAPHHFNENVPERVSEIIMKALQKDPDRRFQRAQEMLDALTLSTDDTVDLEATIPSPPPAEPVVAETRPRRAPRLVAGVVLAVSLALGAYAVGPTFLNSLIGERAGDPSEELADTLAANDGLEPEQSDPTPQGGSATNDPPTTKAARSNTDRPARLPGPSADDGTNRPTKDRARANTPPQQVALETRNVDEPADEKADPRQTNTGEAAQQKAEQPSDARLADAGEDTPPPEETPRTETPPAPADVVLQEARVLQNRLDDAIMDDSWGNMPSPIAAFYQQKLKGLSRKFKVTHVDIVIDQSGLQADGLRAILPITVWVEYQQKGRDGKKGLKIPSTWTWREQGGRLALVNVDD